MTQTCLKPGIFILMLCLFGNVFSQDLNLIGRANFGIGFDYIQQDFKGLKTFYSPGGGLGLEAGAEGELPNDLFWYGTVGYTQNLNFHFEDVNGVTTKTAYGWNKWFFTGGTNRFFDIRNKYIENVFGGAGLQLAFPGKLRRTINNDYQGRITYRPALGFHLEAGTTLNLIDNFLIRPSIRYRYINYTADEYSKGSVKSLRSDLRKAHGGGIDISVTLVKQIKGGRR